MNSFQLIKQVAFFASEKKAENMLILKIDKLSGYADYLLIAEAQSERQVQAIAENILREMSILSRKPLGIEGIKQGVWVLLDYGDIVVHLFTNSIRHFYKLEDFWAEAERIPCEF